MWICSFQTTNLGKRPNNHSQGLFDAQCRRSDLFSLSLTHWRERGNVIKYAQNWSARHTDSCSFPVIGDSDELGLKCCLLQFCLKCNPISRFQQKERLEKMSLLLFVCR